VTTISRNFGRATAAEPARERLRWRHSLGLVAGLTFVIALMLCGWLMPLRFGPTVTHSNALLQPPSARYWFGTDQVGQDIFARTVRAARTDLPLALLGTALATAVGVGGGLAASTKRRWSEWLMRALDAFQGMPLLILTIALVVIANNSLFMVVIAIALVAGPFYIRLIRSQALALRESRFVEASFACGASWPRVMLRHVLPNLRALILAQTALTAALALLVVSALSFLGIGVVPPTPSWGAMIRDGAGELVNGQWWQAFFPGLFLFGCVLSFNLISDGARDLAARKRSSVAT
jgi:peptide/nickel transport system permease protein